MPNLQKNTFIIPLFLYHKESFKLNTDIMILNKDFNFSFSIFIENYKKLTEEKIKGYKEYIQNLKKDFPNSMIVSTSQGHPLDMMLNFEIGCEYFYINYPFTVSEEGKCIISNYTSNSLSENQSQISELPTKDVKLIDLNNTEFDTDLGKLKDDCKCFTCTNNYTRAYIHHLLKCHELNGNILLILHNLFFIKNLYLTYTSESDSKIRKKYLANFIINECY